MAMPSPTHASQPANRPVTQPEQANFKVLWEDEMKAVNKYAHHKHVFALLLFWENKPGWTDMDTEKEVGRLTFLLENVYKFHVQKQMFRPTKGHVQTQMNKYLSDFIHDYGNEDDSLLIIYYAGHGWALPGGRGKLHLAGKTDVNITEKEKDRVSVDWNESEHIIQDTDADILLIIDCCDSGTLVPRQRPRSRKFELLAACGHDRTTSYPGEFSFTSALIWAMENLAKEDPFSTCKLRLKIKEAPKFAENSPFAENQPQDPVLCSLCPSSSRLASEEHIMLEVLGQNKDSSCKTLGMSRADDKQGDYADFRFHFPERFDEDRLKKIAREMKRIMAENELSLRSITFLRNGNMFQQAALAFLEAARRRKGSPGSASPLTQTAPNHDPKISRSALQDRYASSSNNSRASSPKPLPQVVNTIDREDSSSLAADTDSPSQQHHPSTIRYHLHGLIKCIWNECLAWLWNSKSADSTAESDRNTPT